MTSQDDALTEVRARLTAERAELVSELEVLNGRLEVKGEYSLGAGDPMIYQWELNLAQRDRVQKKLAELDEALAQLDQGAYGRCERCGQLIDPERLAVLPHTTLCTSCAQKRR